MWLVGWLVFGSARNDEQLLLADSAVVVPTQAQIWEVGMGDYGTQTEIKVKHHLFFITFFYPNILSNYC